MLSGMLLIVLNGIEIDKIPSGLLPEEAFNRTKWN